MSRNYKFHNEQGLYFVSFATVNWVDVFIRSDYLDILANSVRYCREYKGMEVYAYCFMPSHVHFVFRSSFNDPAGLIRDFKSFTAKRLLRTIEENIKESRREWMLKIFKDAGNKKTNIKSFQFWQHHNKPIELWSNKVIEQKINYIHSNPVISGFVVNPCDWKYSSARNYQDDDTVLKIDI